MLLMRHAATLVVVTASLLTLANGCQTLTLGSLAEPIHCHKPLPRRAKLAPPTRSSTTPVREARKGGGPLRGRNLSSGRLEYAPRLCKRFRRENIELYRKPPNQELFCKMEVQYDRSKRVIPPLYNYAVHPGDRLVITEDPSEHLDDMLDSLKPPSGTRPA